MNAEKAKRIEVNLSGVEKKIFEAVPIGEAWDTGKMGIELRRLGHNIDPRTITACCGKLAGTKLIREPKKGWFRKNVFREKQEHIKLVKDFPIESFEPEICEMSEKKDLLAVLGTATAKIREAANEIE